MARIKLLTSRQIETLPPGFHADGGNLYLRVRGEKSRAWVFRYKRAGRVVELGLGATISRDIIRARDIASQMRGAIEDGGDPAAVLKRYDAKALTFEDYATELMDERKAGWRNAKHRQQWENTLKTYAYPAIGKKRPGEVTTADLRDVLKPLWSDKTETARRLRQRIEAVLDHAAAIEGDDRPNPARWHRNLDRVFPAAAKVMKPKHHPAAHYTAVPAIMAALRTRDHTSAMCLRFAILTAARSGEARGALWSEIDLKAKTWVVPAARMKAQREWRVPLCDEAVKVLKAMLPRKLKDKDLVFPGAQGGLLSDVAVNKTLHLIQPDVTAHGFRSSFREWGANLTPHPSAVLEAALAHHEGNRVVHSYQRSDLYEPRKLVMKEWGAFCAKPPLRLVKGDKKRASA